MNPCLSLSWNSKAKWVISLVIVCFVVMCTLFLVTSPSYHHIRSRLMDKFNGKKDRFQSSHNGNSWTSFSSVMRSFPWEGYDAAVSSMNLPGGEAYTTLLVSSLLPFLVNPPLIPVNSSCEPPPLTFPQYQFSPQLCRLLKRPRKVGVLLTLGFDVDALEIHLHELDAVVDKFFILEMNRPHNHYLQWKPSIWNLVKYTPRFIPFLSKVVHFFVDDAQAQSAISDQRLLLDSNLSMSIDERKWLRENEGVLFRWKKFLEWNSVTEYFESHDLLGFGETDEIPNRNNIYYLKHCELPADPMGIGIRLSSPFMNTTKQTHLSAPERQWVLGDSTYWTLGTAMQYWETTKEPPKGNIGHSPGHMLGGMHMSHYPYLPFYMLKSIAANPDGTELKDITNIIKIAMTFYQGGGVSDSDNHNVTCEGGNADMKAMFWMAKYCMKQDVSLGKFKTTEYRREAFYDTEKIPWFLQCNLERYPAVAGRRDPRLNGLS